MLGLGFPLAIQNNAIVAPVSGPVGTASAVLNHITGTDKSSHLDVASPYYQFITNAVVSSACMTRATLAAANSKHHLEWHVDHFRSDLYFGYGEGSVDFSNIVGTVPGNGGGGNGITCRINSGGTLLVYANGGLAVNTGFSLVAGDSIVAETDTGANSVHFYLVHAGTPSSMAATITLASQIPSTWIAFGGGADGDGTLGASDAATFVPKAADWAMTPNTGFNNYYS